VKTSQTPAIVPVPAVNAVIFNEHREVLLTQRSKTVREPGKWCLPGGHLEVGELWTSAVEREIKEEVGIQIKNYELSGIYSDPLLTVTQEVLPDGYYAQFVVAVFVVRNWDGEFEPNEEVEEWDWFSIENFPDPMLKSHPVRAIDAFRYRGEVFVR
jgi:mutator protein MutT